MRAQAEMTRKKKDKSDMTAASDGSRKGSWQKDSHKSVSSLWLITLKHQRQATRHLIHLRCIKESLRVVASIGSFDKKNTSIRSIMDKRLMPTSAKFHLKNDMTKKKLFKSRFVYSKKLNKTPSNSCINDHSRWNHLVHVLNFHPSNQPSNAPLPPPPPPPPRTKEIVTFYK